MSELCPWDKPTLILDFIHKILEWSKKQTPTFKELIIEGQEGSTGDACFFEVINIIFFENVRVSLPDPPKHRFRIPTFHRLDFGGYR